MRHASAAMADERTEVPLQQCDGFEGLAGRSVQVRQLKLDAAVLRMRRCDLLHLGSSLAAEPKPGQLTNGAEARLVGGREVGPDVREDVAVWDVERRGRGLAQHLSRADAVVAVGISRE